MSDPVQPTNYGCSVQIEIHNQYNDMLIHLLGPELFVDIR